MPRVAPPLWRRYPRAMKKAHIEEFFSRLSAANPDPKSELDSVNTFTFLVAVVMSAQATDAGVNKATKALFQVADSPSKMLELGEDGLTEYIKTVGLFRTKARNVIKLCEQLIADHGGEVPNDRASLQALPGVGRKTANVVLNVAFGEPTMAVDTHVFRVGNRTSMAPGKNPLEVENGLLKVVPKAYMHHAHHWLILHGRHVCKARKPDCAACIVSDLCAFDGKTVAP